MLTGFYDLKPLTKSQLKKMYAACLVHSHAVFCESKYTEDNRWRGPSMKYSISDFMQRIDKVNNNVFIDRSVQGRDLPGTDKGEVGFKLDGKYEKEWHQITFELSLDRLRVIANDFNLVMQ